MRVSRGMGAISKAKVRSIKKRDGNEPVKVFKAGGRVKKFDEGGKISKRALPAIAMAYALQGGDSSGQRSKFDDPQGSSRLQAYGGGFSSENVDVINGKLVYNGIPISENMYASPWVEGQMANGQGGVTGGGVNLNYNFKKGGKVGLYANIHAKKARIAAGSKEKMRKPNSPGAPTDMAFMQSAKTAKKSKK